MRNKFGTICMALGAALIFGALSLFIHNQREAAEAQEATDNLLPQLVIEIERQREEQSTDSEVETQLNQPLGTPVEFLDSNALEMTEVEIDGYAYIGYLSIPKMGLELPVMSDWDDTRLKLAPCRYTGSVRGEDLVIMAHNYVGHFGGLSVLSEGDGVIFTDMDGVVTSYKVVGLDVLAPTAVEEMTAGVYDLTLFTCTYGGENRVTVYCDRVKNG